MPLSPVSSDTATLERPGTSGSNASRRLTIDNDSPCEKFEPVIRHVDHSTAFLDGLRGLAALCVFIQHYIPGFDWQVHEHGFGQLDNDGTTRHYLFASLPFIRIFFNGGGAAVAIFFVLSGYVLSKAPLQLLRDGQRSACRTSLISSVVRRPIRLYIPILTITFLTAVISVLPGPVMEPSPFVPPKATVWAEIVRWWEMSSEFFNPFQEHSAAKLPFHYNAVAWTLPIELKGSMLIYALLATFRFEGGSPGRGTICFFLLADFLLHIAWWPWSCFVFGLMLGVMDVHSLDISILEQHFTPRARSIFYNACFWIGWYLLSQPAVAGRPIYSLNTPGWETLTRMVPATFDIDRYYRYWQTWGSLLLVYACLRLTWLQNILHSKALRYMGKVSFMLYLVHLPFFKIFGDRLSRAVVGTLPKGMSEPEHETWYDRLIAIPEIGPTALNTRFLLCMAINLPITLVVAHIGTVWIDRPSIRLGKKLSHKLGLDVNSNADERSDLILPRWAHSQTGSGQKMERI